MYERYIALLQFITVVCKKTQKLTFARKYKYGRKNV